MFSAIAMLCVASSFALASVGTDGEITVSGQVTVNGQSVVSNSTVVSGSSITTGAGSGATVNLGSKGKVELLSDTTITLKFTENSIVAMLSTGKIRVLNSAGIGATVTTNKATVVADTGQANSFTVDVGCGDDIKCSQTFVETASGLVTLRTSNVVKQVAAGMDAASGNLPQTGCKPCMRPGSTPPVPTAGLSGGAIAAILAAAGGAAFLAIWLGRENKVTTDGGVTIISPIQ
ncbi:MAG: hypothetical protein KDB79_00370 [Acidobacteria bacterium]|nr:hypothetical protein [Acidobacteriota bacterium]